jgi:hypothetical protein
VGEDGSSGGIVVCNDLEVYVGCVGDDGEAFGEVVGGSRSQVRSSEHLESGPEELVG